MPSGRYIKRQNMSGKILIFTILRVQIAFKYDFLIHGGPIYLPIKYWNFAQSPFKNWYLNSTKLPVIWPRGTLLNCIVQVQHLLFVTIGHLYMYREYIKVKHFIVSIQKGYSLTLGLTQYRCFHQKPGVFIKNPVFGFIENKRNQEWRKHI